MEKIEVSGPMKAHILTRLQALEPEQASPSKATGLRAVRKYVSIAACLAILLAGSTVLTRLWNHAPPDSGPVTGVPQFVQAASAGELSELVGFEVTELQGLPFQADCITYTAYGDQLAEIEYQGEEQTATFRKSVGSEDNFGDYTVYGRTEEIQIRDTAVTLKGDGETYALALWSDGTYAYSLKMTEPLAAEAWRELLSGMVP